MLWMRMTCCPQRSSDWSAKKRHDRSSQIEMSAITLIPQNRRKGKRRRLRQKHGAAECFHQTLDPFCPSLVHPPPPNFSFATVFSFTLHRGVLRRFHVLPLNQALTSPLSLSLSPPLPSSYLSLSLSLSVALPVSARWSRSWRRKAADAPSSPSSTASTSTAASAAARPSPSCSTPSASARTASTTSARPAAPTARGTKRGSAQRARRAG